MTNSRRASAAGLRSDHSDAILSYRAAAQPVDPAITKRTDPAINFRRIGTIGNILVNSGVITESDLYALGGAPLVRKFSVNVDNMTAQAKVVVQVDGTDQGKVYRLVKPANGGA